MTTNHMPSIRHSDPATPRSAHGIGYTLELPSACKSRQPQRMKVTSPSRARGEAFTASQNGVKMKVPANIIHLREGKS